jgi:amidase
MRRSLEVSRRQFLHTSTTVAAATIAATGPLAAGEPPVQAPPPASTAPRVLRKPPLSELKRIAGAYGLELNQDDLTSFRNLMDGVLTSYRRLDQFAEPTLPVGYRRDAGYRPTAVENRLNAWYWKCSIKGAQSGPLAGKKIAIKDNVCVAGIPMMNGSNVLEGYVPDVDATIVTRILDAAERLSGKQSVSTCVSRGAATPPIPARFSIRTIRNDLLAAPRAAARPWS